MKRRPVLHINVVCQSFEDLVPIYHPNVKAAQLPLGHRLSYYNPRVRSVIVPPSSILCPLQQQTVT